jgi:plasmid maintenance system antidote protein VapI
VTAGQLQKLLDRAGLSQRGAAKALEINERTMRKYVSGDSPIPKTVELAMLHLASTAQRDCKPSGGA